MSVLIGYISKQYTPRPAGFEPTYVTEIASVSDCISKRPEGWIEEWRHNDWWVYDKPEIAREVATKLNARDWPVAAYLVHAVEFLPTGEERQLTIETNASPIPKNYYGRLGWDVASKSYSPDFECSPLSCNGMATEVAVNAACLLNSLDEAIAFARRCAREQPEPGNYFVIEVWRELLAA